MRLLECRAVLTGASGGIGLALAERLCAGGAQLIAVTRQEGRWVSCAGVTRSRCGWWQPI